MGRRAKLRKLLKSAYKNFSKRGTKDILSMNKWQIYLDSQELEAEGLHLPYEVIVPFAEQLVYRLYKCKDCYNMGECLHCGCAVPDAMITANNTCSAGNWQEMMDPDKWENYKRIMGLNFKIEYQHEQREAEQV